MPTLPPLRRSEAADRIGKIPKGSHRGHRAVNAPEAVGGMEEGDARLGGSVIVPLGVPDVEGPPQAVPLRHQGDVVRLGQPRAAGVFVVRKIAPQSMGLEKGLNIPVLAVADEKEGTAGGERRQGLLHPGVEDAPWAAT